MVCVWCVCVACVVCAWHVVCVVHVCVACVVCVCGVCCVCGACVCWGGRGSGDKIVMSSEEPAYSDPLRGLRSQVSGAWIMYPSKGSFWLLIFAFCLHFFVSHFYYEIHHNV